MSTVRAGSAADGRQAVPARRLAAIGVVAVIFQSTVVSQVPPFAGSADLVPLVAMTVGLLFGSLPGAVFGFGVGLGVDLLLAQTLGQYALIDLAIGYAAGRLGELRNPEGSLATVLLGAASCAVAILGYGLLEVLLGGGASVSVVVLQQAILSVLWGALLALPVAAAVTRLSAVRDRRDGGRPGRRRAYATGGLSPLTPGRRR